MEVIPSIDIVNGKVARLIHGKLQSMKFYKDFKTPIEAAKKWESLGADALHVIDIDAALDNGNNKDTIHKIIKSVNIPVQVGGGIKNIEDAEFFLNIGAERIIFGSLAFTSNIAIRKIIEKYGNDRLIIATDHLNGIVMIKGWRFSTGILIENAIRDFQNYGVKMFLVTSIAKDGSLTGPDIETLKKICDIPSIKIFASGGITTINDVYALKEIGVSAIVIGRALYEGILNFSDIIKYVKR